jgi:hypothetical protein
MSADETIQAVIQFLQRSNLDSNSANEEGGVSAPSNELGAKFAALRKKISNGADGKRKLGNSVQQKRATVKPVRTIDLIKSPKSSGGINGAVLIAKINGTSSEMKARVFDVVKEQVSNSTCLAICILATHAEVLADIAWSNLLKLDDGSQRGFFYIVVPAVPGQPEEVWYCGCFRQSRLREGAMRATIDAAVKSKQKGQAFAKVAKTWSRLGELVGDPEGMNGGGASRMEHLFARTAPEIRKQLQMDTTASFSVTDEVRKS